MFHLLVTHQPNVGDIFYETDRMHFIGRGRTTADPQVLDIDAALSGSAGAVLDPGAAIRCQLLSTLVKPPFWIGSPVSQTHAKHV